MQESREHGKVVGVTFTIKLPLEPAYVDYLGHVTAAAHLTLFEAAHTRWLGSVIGDATPAFVLAHLELDYRRELLLGDGPATVSVRPVRIGRSSVELAEELRGCDGELRTASRAVLVRWDPDWRRAMAFPAVERANVEAQVDGG